WYAFFPEFLYFSRDLGKHRSVRAFFLYYHYRYVVTLRKSACKILYLLVEVVYEFFRGQMRVFFYYINELLLAPLFPFHIHCFCYPVRIYKHQISLFKFHAFLAHYLPEKVVVRQVYAERKTFWFYVINLVLFCPVQYHGVVPRA